MHASSNLHNVDNFVYVPMRIRVDQGLVALLAMSVISKAAAAGPDSSLTSSRKLESMHMCQETPFSDADSALGIDDSCCECAGGGAREVPTPPWMPGWDNSIAICATMKSENVTDVREWLQYYRCSARPCPQFLGSACLGLCTVLSLLHRSGVPVLPAPAELHPGIRCTAARICAGSCLQLLPGVAGRARPPAGYIILAGAAQLPHCAHSGWMQVSRGAARVSNRQAVF